MKNYIITFLFFGISPLILKSQMIFNHGAVSTSMAGLNATSVNVWSVNNNIGQLANLEYTTISGSVFQPFLISDFNTSNLAVGIISKSGGFGISYSNYGNEFLHLVGTNDCSNSICMG